MIHVMQNNFLLSILKYNNSILVVRIVTISLNALEIFSEKFNLWKSKRYGVDFDWLNSRVNEGRTEEQ